MTNFEKKPQIRPAFFRPTSSKLGEYIFSASRRRPSTPLESPKGKTRSRPFPIFCQKYEFDNEYDNVTLLTNKIALYHSSVLPSLNARCNGLEISSIVKILVWNGRWMKDVWSFRQSLPVRSAPLECFMVCGNSGISKERCVKSKTVTCESLKEKTKNRVTRLDDKFTCTNGEGRICTWSTISRA